MGWLNSNDDEVSIFHPAFQAAGNEALARLGFSVDLEWVHHLRTPGHKTVPDFVLINRATRHWVLAVELKRTQDAVFSTRNQLQAKGYAETNQLLYNVNSPKYFAISNLEVTLACALNGAQPPQECVLSNGTYHSGSFASTGAAAHREQFIGDLARMIELVYAAAAPEYETVWPSIISALIAATRDLQQAPFMTLVEPMGPGWEMVRDYFGLPPATASSFIYLFRCVALEYLRGILRKHGHPLASRVPPLRDNRIETVAQAIAAIRHIDFAGILEDNSGDLYRHIPDAAVQGQLRDYLRSITQPPHQVFSLARDRVDAPQFLDILFDKLFPVERQDEYGKVQTDPELANLLAAMAVRPQSARIVDPCCGEGALLMGAIDVLHHEGLTYPEAARCLGGIEADALAVRLALMRIALRHPGAIDDTIRPDIRWGDMFDALDILQNAETILMNPPFKRYENQDQRPIPQNLRRYYENAIFELDDELSKTTSGQSNIYNYYIEYVCKAVPVGTVMGFILDNKWYHSKAGKPLRQFLLEGFEILQLLEYPHSSFFANWMIATSIIVVRKTAQPSPEHRTFFLRAQVDPREIDLRALRRACWNGANWPEGINSQAVMQCDLSPSQGWKSHFRAALRNDYRAAHWPTLEQLFGQSRRGSLQKEGGGLSMLEFPFSRESRRSRRALGNGRPFHTSVVRPLTLEEKSQLDNLADSIPVEFRGLALKNSDDLDGYEISVHSAFQNPTLEPPLSRSHPELFSNNQRAQWAPILDDIVSEMSSHEEVAAYVDAVAEIANLTEEILLKEQLWIGLREPYAGEIVIPRKMRAGHRVHVNPFAFGPDGEGRKLRVSSNFISYGNCIAIDEESGLDKILAVKLIAAFLLSSFGQLQFEMEGYNREGVLALEMENLRRIKVLDPRRIRASKRTQIVDLMENLPYPVSSTKLSHEQPRRNELDWVFAEEIVRDMPDISANELVEEIHSELDEWLLSRAP